MVIDSNLGRDYNRKKSLLGRLTKVLSSSNFQDSRREIKMRDPAPFYSIGYIPGEQMVSDALFGLHLEPAISWLFC